MTKQDEITGKLREILRTLEETSPDTSGGVQEGDKPRTIALVSCVKTKKCVASPAGALYTSDWFRKASSYARQIADEWYILSAKYGLVAPETVIAPYEKTLKKMSKPEREAWADRVVVGLRRLLRPGDLVVFLAGMAYRENLLDPVREMGCRVEIPMKGLSFGPQKAWLKNKLGSPSE